MAHYVWDIEGNGLHEITIDQKGQPTNECDKVHCLVAVDAQTGEMHTFRPHQIDEGWDLLCNADSVIGHNILGYDIPVMERITGRRLPSSVKIIDTFLMAQLLWPDRGNNPAGGYGLKNIALFYGGNQKADYDGGWEEFNEEMLSYCQQDVRTNLDIFRKLSLACKERVPKPVLQLEHEAEKRRGQVLEVLAGGVFLKHTTSVSRVCWRERLERLPQLAAIAAGSQKNLIRRRQRCRRLQRR